MLNHQKKSARPLERATQALGRLSSLVDSPVEPRADSSPIRLRIQFAIPLGEERRPNTRSHLTSGRDRASFVRVRARTRHQTNTQGARVSFRATTTNESSHVDKPATREPGAYVNSQFERHL